MNPKKKDVVDGKIKKERGKNMYYEQLTQQYPVQKTICNRLIPIGKTLENIKTQNVLERDFQRAKDYEIVKGLIDQYHVKVIDEALSDCKFPIVAEIAELYLKEKRDDNENQKLEKNLASMRKEIATCLKKHPKYSILFKDELIKNELPMENLSETEKVAVKNFDGFTTYFTNFNNVRKNLYSDEEKSSTVAYRLVNENLPRFLDNQKVFQLICQEQLDLTELQPILERYAIVGIEPVFDVDGYSYCLTQKGIDVYNAIIGEVNKLINLSIQKSGKKIPKMKVLYKQLLVRGEKAFEVKKFVSDAEVLDAVKDFADSMQRFLSESSEYGIETYMNSLSECAGEGVFVKSDNDITTLSQYTTGGWNTFMEAIRSKYDEEYAGKKKYGTEKYDEEKSKELKKNKSYELKMIQSIVGTEHGDIVEVYLKRLKDEMEEIQHYYEDMLQKVYEEHDTSRKLSKNTEAVASIKAYLDAMKRLENTIKLLHGTGLEARRDVLFYSAYDMTMDSFQVLDELYNMVRNYMTQKPFSTEKCKINFNRSTFLDGWDKNKETANLGMLMTKGEDYYLAVMNVDDPKVIEKAPTSVTDDVYHKMEYKLLPGPNKMLPKVVFGQKNLDKYKPSQELIEKYNQGTHTKGDNFSLEDCHKLIDFFKQCISLNEDWSVFGFHFSDTNSYQDISGFYREVEDQGYKIGFRDIDASYIDQLVEEGKLYLFQIYNKDFSEYSKGNLNLHSVYWKMLFDQQNLKEKVYKLNGGAEVFYRPVSIQKDERIIHEQGKAIKNKHMLEQKEESTFEYDIIKDRRYTEEQFELHVPITMNYRARGTGNFNNNLNAILAKRDDVCVIGIDRGERNLLYVVVVDPKGNILEQISLNTIVSEYKKQQISVNYHSLLDTKEQQRDSARKSWSTIENIKDLKEGYMSQVVYVIAQLVIKYNAVIAIEDLNFGFMRGRQKVEKQVYQKFEKMLIDKLNYLVVDKSRDQSNPLACGGSLNALQLTNKFESFKKMGKQTGIIYYVPAWMTSKIDPATGFANLFYLKYESVEKTKSFFNNFDKISYSPKHGYFEFEFDYSNFTYRADGTETKWTACSYGERIEKFRNPKKNNMWDEKNVLVTKEFEDLFEEYGIDFRDGHDLIQDIDKQENKDFFMRLCHYFKLMLQIRNSSVDGTKDYLQSCVMNDQGYFYNSDYSDRSLPVDADANGAYNIARKGLWILQQIRRAGTDTGKIRMAISDKEWLSYAQSDRRADGR